jgi:hypothetical protein
VRILENPDAFPRAWLVHEAQQVVPGEALPLLLDGTVDPRQTALLETQPPSLMATAAPNAETVEYLHYEPDRIEVRVQAQAPALLVLSEGWDPGWSASVDQIPAPVLIANHILRAVPVPAGEHHIVLSYNPPLLRLGMAVTAATLVLLAGAAVWFGIRDPDPESTKGGETQ